ncbi:MAG: thioredoxin-dependent thiol peroxidase, partial [Crocinitomicaceae bacterium]|nr:thioredoxin-dependent thiol peroxidase [Crocinitomicaceae bacterium]
MKHLKIGDKAPNFEGIDQHGHNISSKDYAGKKTVIYFYPKDNTPGCTTQACSIRDNYDSLLKNGIQVIGVSADSVASHQKFVTKYDLPFPLIADEDKSIIEAFGVWGPKKFMGKEYDGIHRTTFLLDEESNVKGIIEKPNTKAHAEEI